MEQDEQFSDNPNEALRIENEILKIKLKAQYGEAFHIGMDETLPPEVENQFLKSMMAFEDEYAHAEYTTVYERLGKPAYKHADEMSPEDISEGLQAFLALMEQHEIGLDIIDGPYPDKIIYRFITEELFAEEIEKIPVAGMGTNFIYEEFHPNHEAEINKRAHEFLNHWFTRSFNEYCTELSWHCVTSEGKKMTREDVIGKMGIFFEAFDHFADDGYTIDTINFDLKEETVSGMGFAEGMLKYDAVMDNGERLHYEGSYKLYMEMQDNWWSVFYFVIPGFKW